MDSECAFDALGQRHGQQPVDKIADHGVVKQDKACKDSVDTTKTCSDPHRVIMSSGERPSRLYLGAVLGAKGDLHCKLRKFL